MGSLRGSEGVWSSWRRNQSSKATSYTRSSNTVMSLWGHPTPSQRKPKHKIKWNTICVVFTDSIWEDEYNSKHYRSNVRMRVLEDTNTERVSSWLQARLEATTVVSVIPHVAGHHTPSEHEAAKHCQGHTHVEQTEAIGTTWALTEQSGVTKREAASTLLHRLGSCIHSMNWEVHGRFLSPKYLFHGL